MPCVSMTSPQKGAHMHRLMVENVDLLWTLSTPLCNQSILLSSHILIPDLCVMPRSNSLYSCAGLLISPCMHVVIMYCQLYNLLDKIFFVQEIELVNKKIQAIGIVYKKKHGSCSCILGDACMCGLNQCMFYVFFHAGINNA